MAVGAGGHRVIANAGHSIERNSTDSTPIFVDWHISDLVIELKAKL
jgi:hypothetical protein